MKAVAAVMLVGVWSGATPGWTTLSPGVEYQAMVFDPASKVSGVLHVVRVDPRVAALRAGVSTTDGKGPRTARDWCSTLGAVAVINAGMFQMDHVKNVGRLVDGPTVNNAHINDYKSLLAWGGELPVRLLDLDAPGARELVERYPSSVQNLRLIKAPGVSVWKPNNKAWSEAAVAQDAKGNILFLFAREGYEMATFNRLLLASSLRVVNAMHVEGGPEASLSLCTASPPLHLSGSFETGFNPSNDNNVQWPLPNVLAVVPR